MTIFLKKKKNIYAQVHHNLLRNKELSLKAKGLGAWLEMHVDGFELNISFIIYSCKEGRDAVNSTIKELKKHEYLRIEKKRNKKGQFFSIWFFDSEGFSPYTDFPNVDEPQLENMGQKIKYKTKKLNKKNLSSSEEESYINFKKRVLNFYKNKPITKGAKGYLQNTVISLSKSGYLFNNVSQKDLNRDDAIKLWKWLFENQEALLPLGD